MAKQPSEKDKLKTNQKATIPMNTPIQISIKEPRRKVLTGVFPRSTSALILITLALGFFALSPAVKAVLPAPGGGYPGNNTAEGEDALFSLTTGSANTAIGRAALYDNTTGALNAANGAAALYNNTTGGQNTANGASALYSNTTADHNTATGCIALQNNTTGWQNTANGASALRSNTTGDDNTATGVASLQNNTTGVQNTADGAFALNGNINGTHNIALGYVSGYNLNGSHNVTLGYAAGYNINGSNNIALGDLAGASLTTGDDNIDIGNWGVAGEASTIRLGTVGTQTAAYIAGVAGVTVAGDPVVIDASGHLGTADISTFGHCRH
jgi:hypothetical protein